jgi:hypothetical protein
MRSQVQCGGSSLNAVIQEIRTGNQKKANDKGSIAATLLQVLTAVPN